MTKQEQLNAWKEANPGKTDRDWLLEVRCPDSQSRAAMDRLIRTLDKGGVPYFICVSQQIFYPCNQHEPLDSIEKVEWDLVITPGVGKNSYAIEADMPVEVLGQMTKKNDSYSAPIEAYKWLLKKWAPRFDISSLDMDQEEDLLWRWMAFPQMINGTRGFVDWTNPDFGETVVAKFNRDKASI